MVRKKTLMMSLVVFVLALIFLNFVTVYLFGVPLSPVVITGRVVETGYVRLYVEGQLKEVTIHFPTNTTYDSTNYTCATGSLPKCNNYRYILPLNVSANFFVENASAWKYSLYDTKHGQWVYQEVPFTPNTSVSFVRWGNSLTVFADEEDADWINKTVVFTVEVPNSAPLIEGLDEKIFVCEGERINSLEASYFNVSDVDEEDFSGRDSSDISPKDAFFDVIYSSSFGYNISMLQIVSVVFSKSHIGNYVKDISVIDSSGSLATETTNITVIEVNNAPVITNDLGAQTVWVSGVDSSFNHQVLVSDTEDGTTADGNMSFNLTWNVGNLGFDVNISTGVINYTPQQGDQGSGSKTYSLTVCATDNALSSVHENFSVCSARGYSSGNLSDCDSFTLTVTNQNRAPTIDSYYPVATNFTVAGTTTSSFSAAVSDDDMVGSSPDINWYVDGVLKESNENKSSDQYSYAFGCGVSGSHNVTIITTDGLLNDSYTWDIEVTNVACPAVVAGGTSGGGGGGGAALGGICNEHWVCNGWGLCQNSERSFNAGSLSPEDYSSVRDLCAQNQYDDRFCGFQITRCFDLEACNNTQIRIPRPSESRVCYFTENPNCADGITNCHDDDCELLVDCGGPCGPCPTCSDNKKNQGENGVDCGGPCPYACEFESPFGEISIVLVILLVALLVVMIFIIVKLINILRYKFFLAGKRRRKERR